jgi:elongation factor G
VVDVKVRLVDGKSHSVDSSDAAFQAAGLKAFRAAVAAAGPVLLQPVTKLRIAVPEPAMGEVLGDLNARHGRVLQTETSAEGAVISAYLPLAEVLEYEPRLRGMTHGAGTFTFAFDHYDRCPAQLQERVIRESGYRPEADED